MVLKASTLCAPALLVCFAPRLHSVVAALFGQHSQHTRPSAVPCNAFLAMLFVLC